LSLIVVSFCQPSPTNWLAETIEGLNKREENE